MTDTELPTVEQMTIRWMIRADVTRVLEIENASFDAPWSRDDLIGCLSQRNCIAMVAADRIGNILGFMVYELSKESIHVLNFAVAPEARRRYVGTQLVSKLMSKLGQQRRREISLCTRESNLPSQLFWKDMGFRCVEIIKDYYLDCLEDAYMFRFRINEPAGELLQPGERIGIW